MVVFFVILGSNSIPYISHQFIMMFFTIVKATICFTERIGFFPSGYKESFGGESANFFPRGFAFWEIAGRHGSSSGATQFCVLRVE